MKTTYWAILVTALYFAVLVVSFLFLRFDFGSHRTNNADVIYIDLTEPPKNVTPPPSVKHSAPVPRHENVAKTDNSHQVSGKDAETRTVNSRALFPTNKGGADEAQNQGNPYAKEGEREQAKGTGGGLNSQGNEFLDEGLQGRGLVGVLPKPIYPPGNQTGKVVIRVTVDKTGRVTDAVFEPKGSTTSASVLVESAVAAARKARFTESKAFIQGGTITYYFKVE